MADFDPVRFSQLLRTKQQVGDKAPDSMNAEIAALAVAQLEYVPSLEEVAREQVLRDAEFKALTIKAANELNVVIDCTAGDNDDPQTILAAIEQIRGSTQT